MDELMLECSCLYLMKIAQRKDLECFINARGGFIVFQVIDRSHDFVLLNLNWFN